MVSGFAKVGVEAEIANGEGEVVSTCFLVLLLPDAATLDQLAARGAPENAVGWGQWVVAGDGLNSDVEIET